MFPPFPRRIEMIRNTGETLRTLGGKLVWMLPIEARISCQMNFEVFPFDTQICPFYVRSSDMAEGKDSMVYNGTFRSVLRFLKPYSISNK